MKTIYLGSDYICHANNDGTMQAVQTDVFDGLCDGALECYRFIPAGQEWTRSDGQVFHGPFIQPCKPTEVIDGIQKQHEADDSARLADLGIPQEQGFSATRRYTIGSFLSVFGEIYEVISIILNGAQIIPGSNVCKSTVAEYIKKKSEEQSK